MTESLGHNRFQKEIKELEEELKRKSGELVNMEVQNERMKTEIEKLNGQILQMTAANAAAASASASEDHVKGGVVLDNTEHETLKGELLEKDTQINLLLDEMKNLRDSLASKGVEVNSLQKQATELKGNLEDLSKKYNIIKEKLDEADREKQISETLLKSHKREIETLRKELESKEIVYEEVLELRRLQLEQKEREEKESIQLHQRRELENKLRRTPRRELRQLRQQ